MSNSIALDTEALSAVVAKVLQARRLYGTDSGYAIGMVTGLGLLLEAAEGGTKIRDAIHSRILEAEAGKSPRPAPEPAAVAGAAAPAAPAEGGLAENSWIKGVVKWFNNDKGYGFISTDSHIDVFVHWRDISSWDRSLAQGDDVEFMVTRTAKGFQAINVIKGGQPQAEARPGGQAAAGAEAPAAEARPAPSVESTEASGDASAASSGGGESAANS